VPSLHSWFLLENLRPQVRVARTILTLEFLAIPYLLYGCETWTLTLKEEHRLRVFENRVLRRIFGLKRIKATGEWRKLHKRSFVICTLRQL
jgi:hypothetical protein